VGGRALSTSPVLPTLYAHLTCPEGLHRAAPHHTYENYVVVGHDTIHTLKVLFSNYLLSSIYMKWKHDEMANKQLVISSCYRPADRVYGAMKIILFRVIF